MTNVVNPRIEALDNKISVLTERKKRMVEYQTEYPDNENIRLEVEQISKSIQEAQAELKEEIEFNQ